MHAPSFGTGMLAARNEKLEFFLEIPYQFSTTRPMDLAVGGSILVSTINVVRSSRYFRSHQHVGYAVGSSISKLSML